MVLGFSCYYWIIHNNLTNCYRRVKMTKIIMRDIQKDDIIFEKKLTIEKAIALKQILDRYTDASKLEVKIIEKEKKNDSSSNTKRIRNCKENGI